MENKTVKLTNSKQEVKPLDVTIVITNNKATTDVTVQLWKPKGQCLYQYTFLMLPNVPLETYVQTTFGMYNALCKDETENA